ncbi:NUDIX domain-containing protein [Streptomyces violaceusniger]|uniref:NUDIX domain-containing protein n=1 Tax=Streptomyces violaceusniger TaxID=68280 RepID=UPI00380F77B2
MTDTDNETICYTADVVVITRDRLFRRLVNRILRRTSGSVLLIQREWPPYEGAWALPGGHVDRGEPSPWAASRELAEEAGVHVQPADLQPVTGHFDAPDRDPRGRYVTAAYIAVVPAGTPIVAGDDARTARWWPLDDLPELAFDHAEILRAALGSTL